MTASSTMTTFLTAAARMVVKAPAARGMDPTELHQWGEPKTPAPSAPKDATAGVGSQPATDPKSIPVPGSPNPEGAGKDERLRMIEKGKEIWDGLLVQPGIGAQTDVKYPALPGDTIGGSVKLNLPPYSQYKDPDASDAVPTPSTEQLDFKLNGRKQPVNPNGAPDAAGDVGAGTHHPLGLDPTLVHVDSELGGEAVGELSTKVTTAPIDHVPDWEPSPVASGAPATGGGTSSDGDWRCGRNKPGLREHWRPTLQPRGDQLASNSDAATPRTAEVTVTPDAGFSFAWTCALSPLPPAVANRVSKVPNNTVFATTAAAPQAERDFQERIGRVCMVSVRPTHLESSRSTLKDRVHEEPLGGHDGKRQGSETAALRR